MNVGDKVFVAVEITQIIHHKGGTFYKVAIDPEKDFMNTLLIEAKHIKLQEINNGCA